jgi:bacterioferritin-associated ferredoxin
MDESYCQEKDCDACPERLVCLCLRITEEKLVDALATGEITTVKDIRRLTGAGDGCTACHKLLKSYLEGSALTAV